MKKIIFLLLCLPLLSFSQVIPDSIRVDWSKAGLRGTVPQFSNVVDVTNFGAIPNDNTDDYPAVAGAIGSLGNKSGVIYFPPGNYIIKSTINLPDSVIIRGAGSDSTTLTFNFNNVTTNSINISKGQAGGFYPVVSGYNKGSRSFMVAYASTLFSSGDMIEIRETNGSWDTNPASWATYAVGHLAKVDSATYDSLWIDEPLRMNLDSALNPEVRKIVPRTMCGLECFKMTRVDSTATSVNYGVYYNYADNCWMRGVESFKSLGAHVTIETASHIYISGCYFHESYIYDGTSTNGYGIVVITHSCSNLIEDNIFKHLRHCMIPKQGSNGNVFGYNYSLDPNRSETPSDYGADICLHGHYAFANLFEGNISQNLNIDQTWGPSGPFNTFFRNKLELYGIIMTSGTVQSDKQNFVGNDVTNTTFLHGNYMLAGSNHFQYGNNIKGTITPSGTGSLTDSSYYLDSIPPRFWSIAQNLPSIGVPNASSNDNNPARQRYTNGGTLTLCGFSTDSVITNIPQPLASLFEIKNCTVNHGEIKLLVQSDEEYSTASFVILSAMGQQVLIAKLKLKAGLNIYSLKTNSTLSDGIYIVGISNENSGYMGGSKKIIVIN